jgi:signal transduction histidine kinase
MKRTKRSFWISAIIAVIALSFVAATGFGQWRMRALDRAVVSIADTTAPGVEHLAAARGEIRTLQGLLRERAFEHGSHDPSAVEPSRRALARSIHDYLVLPLAAGERDLWRDLLERHDAFDDVVARFDAEARAARMDAARRTLREDVAAAGEKLDTAIGRSIAFNTRRSHELALEVQQLRATSLYLALGLDVICAAIAVGGALLLRRMVNAHSALEERHRRLEADRALELEQFAGRAAHDILSPLGTVRFALQLAARPLEDEERARIIARGTAALDRVKRLVNGLLEFARAGADPDVDARADLADVLADMTDELRPTAIAAGIELTIQQDAACLVVCSPGVLTSLVANLARNAIKYLGDGPVRRIDIRALDRGEIVRVEVEDTGPGLPPDIEDRVFDAYARSRSSTQPGIGLGLATVKRLAEAHGGRVGVRSIPGQGCTFWFELPKAAAAATVREPTPKPCVA